jgi:hypothetical protein
MQTVALHEGDHTFGCRQPQVCATVKQWRCHFLSWSGFFSARMIKASFYAGSGAVFGQDDNT